MDHDVQHRVSWCCSMYRDTQNLRTDTMCSIHVSSSVHVHLVVLRSCFLDSDTGEVYLMMPLFCSSLCQNWCIRKIHVYFSVYRWLMAIICIHIHIPLLIVETASYSYVLFGHKTSRGTRVDSQRRSMICWEGSTYTTHNSKQQQWNRMLSAELWNDHYWATVNRWDADKLQKKKSTSSHPV